MIGTCARVRVARVAQVPHFGLAASQGGKGWRRRGAVCRVCEAGSERLPNGVDAGRPCHRIHPIRRNASATRGLRRARRDPIVEGWATICSEAAPRETKRGSGKRDTQSFPRRRESTTMIIPRLDSRLRGNDHDGVFRSPMRRGLPCLRGRVRKSRPTESMPPQLAIAYIP